ncbi:hypothetical protein C9E81_01785 [Paracoccus alkanivorans]|uniref:Uncharacterized protein n=1 Tax=Paracoccus alkanivorans TaxID=2116655 RepID=A0A3M0MIN6_9RHOB|nr:hypothetical protein C9E81_01785 [Paracoccus alkanivorans]
MIPAGIRLDDRKKYKPVRDKPSRKYFFRFTGPTLRGTALADLPLTHIKKSNLAAALLNH